jgi:pimeloyl-ACP methyl ester carboxylesterase
LAEAYQPHHTARSTSCQVRGVDYQLLHWGDPAGCPVLLLHGWMDCAATFQFLVDAAPQSLLDCHLIAPDWRGFGRTGWASEGYWFPDYLADLDALVASVSPSSPVALVGHSMGGIVAGLYASARPDRVSHLISLEGFGLPATDPVDAPTRYRRWLDELMEPATPKVMSSLREVADRLRRNNARLPESWAEWLAPHIAKEAGGGVSYRADPRHRWVNPVLYRLEEAKACWREVTAQVLWLGGDEATLLRWLKETPETFADRKACFKHFRYVSVPDAGHSLHHDAPALVAQEIATFLSA